MNKNYFLIIFLLVFNNFFSQINFQPFVNKWTESWPEVVKIGDVNNDGLNDVVLGLTTYGQHPNNYSILVYLQNHNGTLDDPIRYSYADNVTHKEIISIDIGDLNQDGLNDILIGLQSPVSFSKYGIFYQNSNHTLDPLVSTPVSSRLERVRIGDMNNDGINDIVVCTYQSILLLYQNTAGNFQQSIITKPFLFNQSVAMSIMEIGDMNNDGKNDLVLNAPAFYKLYTYLNTDNGMNNAPIVFDTGQWFDGMSIGDVNNDGKKDVVLSRGPNSTSKIRILQQVINNNLYSDNGEIQAYDLPGPIKVADLNNDGKNEIITVHRGWQNVSVYSQNNSGNYNSYQMFLLPYASSYNEDGVAIGDINNDGKKDIIIANYNRGLDILYNISSVAQLGTQETRKENIIKIYPNPATDLIHIKSEIKFERYSIYDLSGRMIKSGDLINNEININSLSIGKYIIEFHSKKDIERFTTSFIKK